MGFIEQHKYLFLTTIVALVISFGLEADANSANPWLDWYKQRYDLENVDELLTNNRGDGYDDLYGTRNMRMVLDGLVYRGGANNYYHKTKKRDNRNPLPDDGLENLCQEGFGTAIYLYTTNYNTAPKVTRCASERKPNNELHYLNLQPRKPEQAKEMLRLVYENIQDYRHGPMYLHCWNGWHASGQIAAFVLRQFCGWGGDEAVEYWKRNAVNGDSGNYKSIRRSIREFQPYPEYAISNAQAQAICP